MSAAAPTPGPNMGQPIPRVDAVAKVTGRARYASDVPVARPAYAFLVLSTVGKGRITAIDDNAARAVPGVLDVMTYRNRPPVQPIKFFFQGGPGLTGYTPLSGPDIHFDGQIIGLVTADTFEAAREGAYKLKIDYDAEKPSSVFDSPGTKTDETAKVNPTKPDPKLGDAPAAYAASAHTIDARYATPPQHHNAMELFTTTAEWHGDELTLNEPSQYVYGLREGVSTQLGISRDKVHVRSEYLGGAFGSKGATTNRTVLVALAAKKLGRPVKLVATRDQGFTISGHRQETRNRVRMGANAAGHLTAYTHDIWELTDRIDGYANGGVESAAAMYAFPAVSSTGYLVAADRNTPTFMRSPPELPVMFALESAMDELAEKCGIDPVEFRRLNDTDKDWVTGKPYSSRSLMKCYDQAAAKFGWAARNPKPASTRKGDWLVGYGCATACYPTAMAACVVRMTLTADGRVRVDTAAQDVGQGVKTAILQHAMHYLGVPESAVTVYIGDTTLPPGPIAGGSVSTASAGSAIKLAADKIAARLGTSDAAARPAAFHRLNTREIVELGEYAPEGTKPSAIPGLYKAQLAFSGADMQAHTQYAMGAEFVEVHVHSRTHEVRVPRMVGAFAAGRIVNPRTAHSQLMGGMIWGVSSALHEATEIDTRRAAYTNNNLAEYLIPVNADIGEVDILLVPEVDDKVNPAGVKGLGELANVGTAAAVCNAVYHATGKRIRELPVRVEKLMSV